MLICYHLEPELRDWLRRVKSGRGGAMRTEDWWKQYRLRAINHPAFKGRALGALSQAEWGLLQEQWLPVIKEHWASSAQQQDWQAITAARNAWQLEQL